MNDHVFFFFLFVRFISLVYINNTSAAMQSFSGPLALISILFLFFAYFYCQR